MLALCGSTSRTMRKSNVFRVERLVSHLYCFICVLQPPSPEEKEVLEDELKEPAEPRQMTGLDTEREIEEESVSETRKKVECRKFFHLHPFLSSFFVCPSSNHCASLL